LLTKEARETSHKLIVALMARRPSHGLSGKLKGKVGYEDGPHKVEGEDEQVQTRMEGGVKKREL